MKLKSADFVMNILNCSKGSKKLVRA